MKGQRTYERRLLMQIIHTPKERSQRHIRDDQCSKDNVNPKASVLIETIRGATEAAQGPGYIKIQYMELPNRSVQINVKIIQKVFSSDVNMV